MNDAVVVQGRLLRPADIVSIRELISANPDWSRRRLSEVLSERWGWRNASGRLKDMAVRALLVKLEARELITLPARRRITPNRMTSRRLPRQDWDSTPIEGKLADLAPLRVQEVSADTAARMRFAAALEEFHYLGCRGSVGENLQYTLTDGQGRLLACLLFGAAAWKCRARDEFIAWTPQQRQRHLHLIANNSRFLILPFVKVSCLASWVLGQVLRRMPDDWEKKYGHRVMLVETFVERDRFAGTSYKAANWIRVGQTAGRSRQDRHYTLRVPVKDIYVYPLHRAFRQELAS